MYLRLLETHGLMICGNEMRQKRLKHLFFPIVIVRIVVEVHLAHIFFKLTVKLFYLKGKFYISYWTFNFTIVLKILEYDYCT